MITIDSLSDLVIIVILFASPVLLVLSTIVNILFYKAIDRDRKELRRLQKIAWLQTDYPIAYKTDIEDEYK